MVSAVVRIFRDQPYHWHEDLVIVMTIAGQICIRMWARDNILSAGDFLVINSNEVHKLTAITDDNLVVVTSLKREFCEACCPEFKDVIIICNSYQYREKHEIKYKKIEVKLKRLIFELGKLNSCDEIVKRKGYDFIKHLEEQFNYLTCGIKLERFSDYVIARYSFLFDEMFSSDRKVNNVSLKEISACVGISYAYLRTDIIDRFGHGYSWLKHSIMTEMAARLVLTTDRTLMSISVQCGFSDPKYFIKYFRIFYECKPSDFRKLYQHSINRTNEGYTEISIKNVMQFQNFFRENDEP